MTLPEQRRERRPLRGPFLARVNQPAVDDPGLQRAPNQPEHPCVMHPSCDPRHQRVGLDPGKAASCRPGNVPASGLLAARSPGTLCVPGRATLNAGRLAALPEP
jgi:hypothetical protein